MADPITVLLVDDHEVVRQGVRAYLDALPEFQVVGEAESGAAAVRLAAEFVPDVVLMDLVMSAWTGSKPLARSKTSVRAARSSS